MGSTARKPYLLLGFFHFIAGLLLFISGITWIILTYFFWPQQLGISSDEFQTSNAWNNEEVKHQAWLWLIYTCKTWAGAWMMMTGGLAMGVNDKGCLEWLFFTLNMLTMMIFAPAVTVLSIELLFDVVPSLNKFSFIYAQTNVSHVPQEFFEVWNIRTGNATVDTTSSQSWVLTFPITGMALGFIEIVLASVTCFIFCCCRPTRSFAY